MEVSKNSCIKFKPDDLDRILNEYTGSKLKTLKTTLKYVYSLKDSEDFKKIISINSNTVNINFRKLSWVFVKYFKISFELIAIRKKIIHHLFCCYSSGFSEYEIEVIVKNPSNVWLDANYKKINLLKNYCNELLSDNYFKQCICLQSDCLDEYITIHNLFINIMDKERDVLRLVSDRQKRENEDVRIKAINESIFSLESYEKTFSSETFLDKNNDFERIESSGKKNNNN